MNTAHLEPILNNRFRNFLINKCLQILDCRYELAEDLVQSTYLGLLRTKRFDPERGNIASYAVWWLRGTISQYNQSRRAMKRNGKTQRMVAEPVAPTSPDLVERREEFARTMQAVKTIPPIDQRIIQRVVFDEDTFREIAADESFSRSRAQQIHKRAIERVKSLI